MLSRSQNRCEQTNSCLGGIAGGWIRQKSGTQKTKQKKNPNPQNKFSSASGSFLTTLRTDDDVSGRRGGVYSPSTFFCGDRRFSDFTGSAENEDAGPRGADLHLSERYLILVAPPATCGERLSGGRGGRGWACETPHSAKIGAIGGW